jgi:hypothetical protein
MGRSTPALTLAALVTAVAAVGAQVTTPAPDVLATVRIAESVLANGKPLPPGTYEIRLTGERPAPLAGQSPDAQRRVEFVANKTVVATETAEVLRDDDRPEVGASAQPSRGGTHVGTLKGGEFLRISVKRGTEQYLIHLPIVR